MAAGGPQAAPTDIIVLLENPHGHFFTAHESVYLYQTREDATRAGFRNYWNTTAKWRKRTVAAGAVRNDMFREVTTLEILAQLQNHPGLLPAPPAPPAPPQDYLIELAKQSSRDPSIYSTHIRVRKPRNLEFGLIKGGIEPGERPIDAANRELKEEIGIYLPFTLAVENALPGILPVLRGDGRTSHYVVFHIQLTQAQSDATVAQFQRTQGLHIGELFDGNFRDVRTLALNDPSQKAYNKLNEMRQAAIAAATVPARYIPPYLRPGYVAPAPARAAPASDSGRYIPPHLRGHRPRKGGHRRTLRKRGKKRYTRRLHTTKNCQLF